MKRHPDLQPLSDDHHAALVLARRLRRAEGPLGPALAHEVRQRFAAELEPHFEVEERLLFPALALHGATRVVDQAVADHRRLRALVSGAWSEETAGEIGRLLERHVRFEERSLFPEAEAIVLPVELRRVRDAALASSHRR